MGKVAIMEGVKFEPIWACYLEPRDHGNLVYVVRIGVNSDILSFHGGWV